jgi:hypothetical protein
MMMNPTAVSPLLAFQVGVNRLRFRGWPKRSREQPPELEWLTDKVMTRREHWTVKV